MNNTDAFSGYIVTILFLFSLSPIMLYLVKLVCPQCENDAEKHSLRGVLKLETRDGGKPR